MKILHIASHAGVYRGGAVQMARLAMALRERGHDVDVVVNVKRKVSKRRRAADRATWAMLDDAGISVKALPYEGSLGSLRLKFHIMMGRYDVIHAHRDQALLAVSKLLSGVPRPALVAQRGTISPPPGEPRMVFQSPRVGAVVAVAQAVKDSLIECKVPEEKIHVVYGSVDTGAFAPRPADAGKRSKLGLPADAPVIGSLSAYRKGKGLESLIAALGQVLPRFPSAHAVLLGARVEKKLKKHVDALPADVAARIHLMCHQADVAAWLSIMSITVVAATAREGLSGVLRESLAMGVPVISTDCAGNNEIVRDRETGLLIPPGDIAALAEALDWALGHPGDMAAMAQAGREWVLANCTPAAQAKAVERIYESIVPR